MIVVETMWRAERTTTARMASRSPAMAASSSWIAVITMIAALIETPMEPIAPISACTPNGLPHPHPHGQFLGLLQEPTQRAAHEGALAGDVEEFDRLAHDARALPRRLLGHQHAP